MRNTKKYRDRQTGIEIDIETQRKEDRDEGIYTERGRKRETDSDRETNRRVPTWNHLLSPFPILFIFL